MLVEKVEVLIRPGFTENCYIVRSKDIPKEVIVIDPGAQANLIIERLNGRALDRIVLTHRHYDHIGAVDELVEKTGARVLAHTIDAEALRNQIGIGPAVVSRMVKPLNVDDMLEDGDVIVVGNSQLEVLNTPGHTAGSICLYNKDEHILFAGDTMFFEAVGRTDLPGGNAMQQKASIKRLFLLPDKTRVYPGHDAETTIGHEKSWGPMAYRV